MAKLKQKRKKLSTFDIIVFIVLTILFLLLVIPFWSIIVTSLSTNEAYIEQPFSLWPKEFTWANYISVFARGSGLLIAYKNTIIVSVIGTLLGMVVMTMAAYALSRKFPGKRAVFMYFLVAMFFGGGTIPTYLNIKNLGLNNTFNGVIMLTLCSVGHVIILMKGFEAKEELNGVTLESLVVAERVARAIKVAAANDVLDAKDFLLLMHVDEIICQKKAVNLPWEEFTFVYNK